MASQSNDNIPTIENCPHCGAKLSPWQQVLLGVDHAIVCKNCWYRIIVTPYENKQDKKAKENPGDGSSKLNSGNE